MNLRKRCMAALMAMIMLLTLMPLASIAEESQTENTVVLSDIDANTTVGKAVAELSKLNIINGYEDGTFRPDNTITRGEIAKIIISCKGQQDVAFDTMPSGFADVDSVNHWAKKYIKLAADQKIVNGYPDGTFLADNPVRYVEIVKMLVCMLGYGTIAESRMVPGGAWYSGYMAVAAERGILDNASVNHVEDNASRGVVSILTYNCLDVDVASTDAQGNIVIGESSFLEEAQKKEKITGVVTGVQQTGIYSPSTGLNKRQITMDIKGEEVTYEVPTGTDTMALLGRRISAYAEGTAEDAKISQISVTKTESITITQDLIIDVSGNSVEYYESEESSDKEEIDLDDVKVIYNGKYDDTFAVEDFGTLQSGSVEFICNDGDGDAEVAFVSEYKTYVVSSVDKNSNPPKIYDKYGAGELSVPYESKDVFFSLTETGKDSEPEEIVKGLSEWDVLCVMESKQAEGKEVWKGIVTSKKVSGKITSTEGETKKEIGGKFYTFSESYNAYEGTKPNMEVGDYVTVYLDHEGKIAAAATSAGGESPVTVAYLVSADVEGYGDKEAWVRLYNFSGSSRKTKPTLASPIRIDGTPYATPEEALAALEAAALDANAGKSEVGITAGKYTQLIRYTLNSKGEVDMIDTVVENVSPTDSDLTQKYPFPFAENEDTVLEYSGGRFSGSGGLVFMANSSTKVLEIPYDDLTNIDEFSMPSYSSAFLTKGLYRAEAYNVSGSGAAKYVISYVGGDYGTATINEKSPIMVTSKVNQFLPEDATEPVDKAVGYAFPGAANTTITTETAGILYGHYRLGDIFRYALSDGQVVEAQQLLAFNAEGNKPIIYDVSKEEPSDIAAPVETSDEAKGKRSFDLDDISRGKTETVGGRFVFGTLLDWDESGLVMTQTIKEDTCGVTPNEAKETFSMGSATKVFFYDYTAVLEAEKVRVLENLDVAKAYEKLVTVNKMDEEAAKTEASQVLVFYTGNYGAKAVIVFKYPAPAAEE